MTAIGSSAGATATGCASSPAGDTTGPTGCRGSPEAIGVAVGHPGDDRRREGGARPVPADRLRPAPGDTGPPGFQGGHMALEDLLGMAGTWRGLTDPRVVGQFE
jgi:hypothetical protein